MDLGPDGQGCVYRTTRSNKIFSPFVIKPQAGTPIEGAWSFDIRDALKEENEKRLAKEARGEGYDSEDDVELESDDGDGDDDGDVFEMSKAHDDVCEHECDSMYEDCEEDGKVPPELVPTVSHLAFTPVQSPFRRAESKAIKRRKYKTDQRDKRRIRRANENKDLQRCESMRIKRVARKKAAQAKTLPAPDWDSTQAPVSSAGWTGRRQAFVKEHISLERAFEDGLRLVDWQGDETYAIVDRNKVVISVLGAPPPGKSKSDWQSVIAAATQAVKDARAKISFTAKEEQHRRGDFPAVAYGISFGGGQKRPGRLRHSTKTTAVLHSLLACLAFQRIAGYTNSLFAGFAPRVHEYYVQGLTALRRWKSSLMPNFPGTAFAACTWNFGPFSVSFPHLDSGNVAFGWCAITSLGFYNPDRGGHLILWDLGLVIRFPPGCTILIPSALLVHSNIPIQAGERRYLFIQYSAGGLFRWIYNGFQTWDDRKKVATPSMLAQYEFDRKNRARRGYEKFSSFDEILAQYHK